MARGVINLKRSLDKFALRETGLGEIRRRLSLGGGAVADGVLAGLGRTGIDRTADLKGPRCEAPCVGATRESRAVLELLLAAVDGHVPWRPMEEQRAGPDGKRGLPGANPSSGEHKPPWACDRNLRGYIGA